MKALTGILATFCLILPVAAKTLHVDQAAIGVGDGTSWDNAYQSLQSALTTTLAPGDEIWVAEGLYKPGPAQTDTFVLMNGVELYGGFPAGGGEGIFEARNPAIHLSILSGDIDGNDSQSPIATDSIILLNEQENSFNVVSGNNLDATTIVDGFTITAGNAFGPDSATQRGGGMTLTSSSPTLRNLVFTGNIARFFGGGLHNLQGSPHLEGILFNGNHVTNNSGGGFYTLGGSPVVTNVTFQQNHSFQFNGGAGGAFLGSDVTLTNALFVGNTAYGSSASGGAIEISGTSPTLINVTVAGNGANSGGGIVSSGTPLFINCLVWGNDATTDPNLAGAIDPASHHNLIEGDPGVTDPLFLRPPDPGDGNWNTVADNDLGDLRVQAGSPAIDSGDQAANSSPTDLAGTPRVLRGEIDLGAYEQRIPLFVDEGVASPGNGGSWSAALPDLQSALAIASTGDSIHVATGTYYPDEGTGQSNNSKGATFTLNPGVSIFGGFPAGGGTIDERDPATNLTVLSGDIDKDGVWPDTGNSYHVVTVAGGTDRTAILDGFTITEGYASGATSGDPNGRGGGMTIRGTGGPMLRNLHFLRNRCNNDGGAVMVESGSAVVPLFQNVTFEDNYAQDRGGAVYNWNRTAEYRGCTFRNNSCPTAGGAMFSSASTSILDSCFFEANSSGSGGALYNTGSALNVTQSTFLNNSANSGGSGGAIFNNANSDTAITSCAFLGNTCTSTGGALRNRDDSDVTIVNSLFSGNKAISGGLQQGGAIWNGSIADCDLTIINSTFVGNEAGSSGAIHAIDAGALVQNSSFWANTATTDPAFGGVDLDTGSFNNLIQGETGASDPLFVDPDGADDLAGTLDDNLRLALGSPAIDAGNATYLPAGLTTDLDGAPRVQLQNVDQGPYETGQLAFLAIDVAIPVPDGGEIVIPSWSNDTSGYNEGSGLDFLFTLTGSTGGLSFTSLPVVDLDGSLRFTLAPFLVGSATFSVQVFDPGSTFASSIVQSITISTGSIHYVNSGAGGNNDGTSWDHAFTGLQSALSVATSGDEIWVAAGTYKPTNLDRSESFTLRPGIGLYGGFTGGPTEVLRHQRDPDPASNNTVLSGEIGTAAADDNCRHVVFVTGNSSTTTLDGFTIRDGYADFDPNDSDNPDNPRGGGILIEEDVAGTFENLLITGNHADFGGGGAISSFGSTQTAMKPLFRNVTFDDNDARLDGGAFARWEHGAEFIDCRFTNNHADRDGGAMSNEDSLTVLTSCYFERNTATGIGGAIHNDGSSFEMTAVTFFDNESTSSGGAIYNAAASGGTLINTAFLGNQAGTGAGAIRNADASNLTIVNSILSGNTAVTDGGALFSSQGSVVSITNSTVSGNSAAVGGGIYSFDLGALIRNSVVWGNIATTSNPQLAGVAIHTNSANNLIEGVGGASDPLFIDPDGADDTLGTLDDNLRLALGSPAVGQGNPAYLPAPITTDLDGNARIRGIGLDLGPFESNQLGALVTDRRSSTPHGEPLHLANWMPDTSGFNNGAGLTFTFTQTGSTGNLNVASSPVVSLDGTLSFTPDEGTIGSVTYSVVISDPGGLLPSSIARTFTISTPLIYHVDPAATLGAQDGSSWADAYLDLRTALQTAFGPGDEVWVAAGTYTPVDPDFSERSDTFLIEEEIGIYGGFPTGGSDFSGRNPDPASNNCVLSGEIFGASPFDNSWQVVRVARSVPSCVIDGFTIRDGYAESGGNSTANGAGLYVHSDCTPTLANLIFTDNHAEGVGGALALFGNGEDGASLRNVTFDNNSSKFSGGAVFDARSTDYLDCDFTNNESTEQGAGAIDVQSPVTTRFTDCRFENNTAWGWGGAILYSGHVPPPPCDGVPDCDPDELPPPTRPRTSLTMTRVSFLNNRCRGAGGAIATTNSHLTITNGIFIDNFARQKVDNPGSGGAIHAAGFVEDRPHPDIKEKDRVVEAEVDLTNCAFSRNEADDLGGALFFSSDHDPKLLNCSLSRNHANDTGGGLYSGRPPTIRNSILWGNTGSPGAQLGGNTPSNESSHSLIEDGIADGFPGVLSEDDPLFVDAANDNLRLQDLSPAISLGRDSFVPAGVSTDLDGAPRFFPLAVDAGAYESAVFKLPLGSLDVGPELEGLEDLFFLSTGETTTVPRWVSPSPGFDFGFTQIAGSGNLQFDGPLTVTPEGGLQFTITAGTFGRAIFEVVVTDPGDPGNPYPPFTFALEAGTEAQVLPDISFDYLASTSLTSDPKAARIRGYLQPEGRPRKGIAIYPSGFSQDLPSYLDPAIELDPPSEEERKQVRLSRFARSMFQEGFDVYTVNWHDPRTYLEDNAMVLVDILEGISGDGFQLPAGVEAVAPGEKVALIGPSMGGLISRFALCYLDTNATPYQCDLFLSVDSPQEGAYIPAGFQFLATYLDALPERYKKDVPTKALVSAIDAIEQPAPKEMLVVHHSRGDNVGASHAVERDSFLNLLNNSYGGWPTNPGLRMAAIASGRGDGLFEDLRLPGNSTFSSPKTSEPDRRLLKWSTSQTSRSMSEIPKIAAVVCFYGVLEISVTATLTIECFAVNDGSHCVFRANREATVYAFSRERDPISGALTNRTESGSGTVDLSGSETDIRDNLREQIKELAGLDLFSCAVLNNEINKALEAIPDATDDDPEPLSPVQELALLNTLGQENEAWSEYQWDWLPGGLRNTGRTSADALAKAGSILDVSENQCFIPTTSALAISNFISPQQVAIPDNAADLSPFDDLYHFGTHPNTDHLENTDEIGNWLSDVVSHELNIICGEFAVDLTEAPNSVSYLGPYFMEEYLPQTGEWILRSNERNGVYLLPDPIPDRAFFRLGFQQTYQ